MHFKISTTQFFDIVVHNFRIAFFLGGGGNESSPNSTASLKTNPFDNNSSCKIYCFATAGETKVFGTLQNASNIDLTTCESLLICFEDVDSSTQDASSTIHCVSEGELLNSSFIVEERTFFLQPHHRYYGEVCRLLSCFIRQLFARRIAQNRQPLWVEQTTPQLGSEDMNQLVKNAPWYKRVFSMFSSSFPLVVAAEATPIPIPMDDQSPEPPILTSPLPVLAYSNVVYSTELREANCELCVFMLGQKDSCDADESSATGYLQILVKEADPGNSANSIKPKILQLRGYNVSDICDMSMTFAIYASTSGGDLLNSFMSMPL